MSDRFTALLDAYKIRASSRQRTSRPPSRIRSAEYTTFKKGAGVKEQYVQLIERSPTKEVIVYNSFERMAYTFPKGAKVPEYEKFDKNKRFSRHLEPKISKSYHSYEYHDSSKMIFSSQDFATHTVFVNTLRS